MGMAHVFVYITLIAVLGITGLVSLIYVVYRRCYRRYLDQRVAEHSLGKKKRKKKIFSPFSFALIIVLSVFFVLVLIWCIGVISSQAKQNADDKVLNGVRFGTRDVSENPILYGHTAEDDLIGYRRFEVAEDSGRLIYYLADDPNMIAPQMFFYFDYDAPSNPYEFSFEIDGAHGERFLSCGDAASEQNGRWVSISFPFEFYANQRLYSKLHVISGGKELAVIPLDDLIQRD